MAFDRFNLVEALVIAAMNGGFERYAIGKSEWGTQVIIVESNNPIVYNCPKHGIDNCHNVIIDLLLMLVCGNATMGNSVSVRFCLRG